MNNPVGIAPVPLLSAKAYDGRTTRGAWSTEPDYRLAADKKFWIDVNRKRAAETPVVSARLPPLPGADERRHLVFPGPAAQRPAVDEHDGRSRTVILVVELDRSAILGTDLQPGHRGPPFG